MITTLIAVTIVIAALFVFAFILDKEHDISRLMRLFLILFAITLLVLVPKSAIDSNTICEVVTNSTFDIYIYGNNFSGEHWTQISDPPDASPPPGPPGGAGGPGVNFANYTLFHRNTTNVYDNFCYERPENTPRVLYNAVVWFLRIMWFAIIIYFVYETFKGHKEIAAAAERLFKGRYR